MICLECQRKAERAGRCWRHYRAYLRQRQRERERAYELNAMPAEMRAGILDFEATFDNLLLGGCRTHTKPRVFVGLHDLVTTGVDHA